MVATINASVSSSGLVSTADGSGILKVQSNGVATNSLMWINFGYPSSVTTTRSSYNVSSLTRNSTGIYTLVPVASFSDSNYVVNNTGSIDSTTTAGWCNSYVNPKTTSPFYTAPTTTAFLVAYMYGQAIATNVIDPQYGNITVFGN